ncbi:MAG TPA: hypothetical protein GX707_04945 [Epulopiscium sp.]|nr:hypothetical protein [Candidatus Epulonipiscium sp.]
MVNKELYKKELNCKKNIIEYIEIIRVDQKENPNQEVAIENYNYIYECIEQLRDSVKPNTLMHLKNQLKSQLGKYVEKLDPKPENHFIEFFKEVYPEKKRRKDFTWVLMDINKITDEQAWATLAYINKGCLSKEIQLDEAQKKDIVQVVKQLVRRNDIKVINDLKSLKDLSEVLGVYIEKDGKRFKVMYEEQRKNNLEGL